MSISLHGLLSSKIFRHIQIVLITLLQRKIPNFDAVLPIFCVGPNTIEYTFRKNRFYVFNDFVLHTSIYKH